MANFFCTFLKFTNVNRLTFVSEIFDISTSVIARPLKWHYCLFTVLGWCL